MTRPADQRWEVLGESEDPVPGDVYDLKALSKRFTATAKTISDTAAALRRLGDQKSWDSKAGREFAEKAEDTAKTVSKAHGRYEEAGSALKEYYTELEKVQDEADRLLGQAETKSGDLSTAKSQADNPPEKTDKKGQKTLDTKVTDLQGDLDGLRGQLTPLKNRHSKAGDAAAKRIHEITESDDLNDSWLDELRDTLTIVADIAGAVAAVCGLVALLVGWIPIIGQAIAGVLGTIALIATAISLVCHLLLAINGDGSWGDVALDVLGLATFGIGRVFSAGSKLAATVGRSRVWTAAAQYVRGWNPALGSAARRALVVEMVGARGGAASTALPNVTLGAAFKGLPRAFAEDLGTIRSNWGDLFKVGDNLSAVRGAWNAGGLRGLGSMYVGPGMVDELARIKNIKPADLNFIGTPDAFKQAFQYNSWALGATGTGAASDTTSFVGLFGSNDIDVTGPDASLAER
ncbi:putative T7SS-secreted protein [Streptomyces sp. NPDC087263]|uniref:putative T7SS-secreted protein n=1 Tax=Streptomyces sp. NPDC087263 TaxID=3365773 RepID=UPI00380E37FC